MYLYNNHIQCFGDPASCNAFLPNQQQQRQQQRQQQHDVDWNTKTNNWKDKSDAAKSRELYAKSIFDHQFLPQTKKSTTSFPFTMNDIIPPEIHLTNLCYRDFRKYVISQGCSVSRRVITEEEKAAMKSVDRKRVKMYYISITARDHPDAILKKEQEVKEAQEKLGARIQALREDERMNTLVNREYDLIENHLLQISTPKAVICTSSSDKEASKMDANSNTNKKRPLGDRTNNANNADVLSTSSSSPLSSSPCKKVKVSTNSYPIIKVTVPMKKLLIKADQCHINKINVIQTDITNVKHHKLKESTKTKSKGREKIIRSFDSS